MRFTRYGEPSDKEIDALRQPPYCPLCGDDVPEYGDTCENCDMKPLLKLQEPQKPQNLRAGDRIRHPLRGEGEVISVDKTMIRVSFGETWGVLPENSVRKI